jgi:DNA-binding transcriptional ArsR family regulator
MSRLDSAQRLDAFGLNILPAKGKRPTVDWKQFQHERTTPHLVEWFGNPNGSGPLNLWVLCGLISRVVVLDCDGAAAERYWREKLGDVLDATACVQTARGFHYWFRITEGEWPSWSKHENGLDFEVRGEGGGVIAPPSVHESGVAYRWVRNLRQLRDAPEALRGPTTDGAIAARSKLADLLAGGPNDPKKGNVWMAQVAGHIAKAWPYRDGFEALVRLANRTLADPIAEADLVRLIDSIWTTEQKGYDAKVAAKLDELRIFDEARRQLRSGGWSEPDQLNITATKDPEPEHLGVGGILLVSLLVWLFGEPETGKSLIAYDACLREMQGGRAVVLFDAEAGEADVRQKFQALGATAEQLQYLRVYDVGSVDLLQNPGWPLLRCQEVGARLAVFDSAGALLAAGGLAENENAEVARYIALVLLPMARAGVCTVVLDHVPKSDPHSRYPIAAMVKLGRADLGYNVSALKSFARGRSGLLKLECKKDRSGWIGPGTEYGVYVTASDDGRLTLDASRMTTQQAAVARARVADERFRPLLGVLAKAKHPATTEELAGALELDRTSVSRLLNAAKDAGLVTDANPRRGTYKTWSVAP